METWLKTLIDYKSKFGEKTTIGQEYQRILQGNLLYDFLGKGIDAIAQTLKDGLENHLVVVLSCCKDSFIKYTQKNLFSLLNVLLVYNLVPSLTLFQMKANK